MKNMKKILFALSFSAYLSAEADPNIEKVIADETLIIMKELVHEIFESVFVPLLYQKYGIITFRRNSNIVCEFCKHVAEKAAHLNNSHERALFIRQECKTFLLQHVFK